MRFARSSRAAIAAFAVVLLTPAIAAAQEPVTAPTGSSHAWVDGWTGSAQGVYPVGYSVGQPGPVGPAGPGNTAPLLTAALPDNQAHDQTLRMIVPPSVEGTNWRVRLTNEFGTRADSDPGSYRWSYSLDLGRSRVVVLDNRAGRQLNPGQREMVSPADWAWLSAAVSDPAGTSRTVAVRTGFRVERLAEAGAAVAECCHWPPLDSQNFQSFAADRM